MIPIIAVVASDHGTTVIGFVASRTNPDLVSPFITNLGWTEEKVTNQCSTIHEILLTNRKHELNPKPHHVGTDGLSYYTAHWRLHGRGGRQHRCRREERWRGRSWWKWRGSWWQDGYDGGKHGWRLGHPRLIPRSGFGHRSPGRWRSGVWIWNHLTDNAVDGERETGVEMTPWCWLLGTKSPVS